MSRNPPEREQVYAVVRIDEFLGDETPMERNVTVKEIVRDLAIAEAEVARLNQLNADKNCRYFWQTTRLFEAGESFGTHCHPDRH